MDIKQKIYQLVDTCQNDFILQETIELLQSQDKKEDWWEKLSPAQQKRTIESLEQSESGNTHTHEEVIQNIWKKFSK